MSPASLAHASLLAIEAAVTRATELTAQMLTYAGMGPFQVRALSLIPLVEEQITSLGALLPRGATLRVMPEADATVVAGDPALLRQLLVNLVTNAVESLADGVGTIQITTGASKLEEMSLDHSLYPEELRPGRHGFIDVTDTGSVMEPETVARKFEPFFTTRSPGRRLGLAAVAGIVRQHHGTVTVESEPGRGTTVRGFLPIRLPVRARGEGADPGRSAGTVMMVDDERDVLRLMGTFLKRAGFEVVLAAGGTEAVARFRGRGGDIDVVILDLTMPGMSGDETLAALRELDPDLPAIITSGYTRAEVAHRCAGHRFSAFLLKPCLPAELTEQVREVVTAARPHPAGNPGQG